MAILELYTCMRLHTLIFTMIMNVLNKSMNTKLLRREEEIKAWIAMLLRYII